MMGRVRKIGGVALEIVPGDGLRLAVEGRDVGEARRIEPALAGLADEQADGEDGLAEPPMGHQHAEALEASMQVELIGSRLIGATPRLDQSSPQSTLMVSAKAITGFNPVTPRHLTAFMTDSYSLGWLKGEVQPDQPRSARSELDGPSFPIGRL
ncbi:MAG: hypothetical protein ACREEV_18810 [Dongiaceae bacterium]